VAVLCHCWSTLARSYLRLRLQDARRRSRDCSGPLETDLRWKEVFAYEQAVIDKKMSDYDLERQVNPSTNPIKLVRRVCKFYCGVACVPPIWVVYPGRQCDDSTGHEELIICNLMIRMPYFCGAGGQHREGCATQEHCPRRKDHCEADDVCTASRHHECVRGQQRLMVWHCPRKAAFLRLSSQFDNLMMYEFDEVLDCFSVMAARWVQEGEVALHMQTCDTSGCYRPAIRVSLTMNGFPCVQTPGRHHGYSCLSLCLWATSLHMICCQHSIKYLAYEQVWRVKTV